MAAGEQALRDGNLEEANDKFTEAWFTNREAPDSAFMRSLTLLGRLYEAPMVMEEPAENIEAVLSRWGVSGNRNLYQATADDFDLLEPFPADPPPISVTIDEISPAVMEQFNALIGNNDNGGNSPPPELLIKVENAGPSWSRTVTQDMIPPVFDVDEDITFNHVDIVFMQAALHSINFLLKFVAGYDLDVDYDDVRENDFISNRLTQEYWDTHSEFFTERNSSSFPDAKDSLESAFQKAIAGVDAVLGSFTNPIPEGIIDIDEDSREDWEEAKDLLSSLLQSLTENTSISAEGVDPIMINLGKLFDAPLNRTDLAALRFNDGGQNGTDGDLEFDFDAWDDPTLNGIFPDQTTKANWYADVTKLEEVPIVVFRNIHREEDVRIVWGSAFGLHHRFDGGGERIELAFDKRDYLFTDKIVEFRIFRSVDLPENQTLINTISGAVLDQFLDEPVWQDTDEDRISAEKIFYQVEIEFSDGVNRETISTEFAMLDQDSLSDPWELFHFGSLEFGDADDPDDDHLTNLQEFQKNVTSPNHTSDFDGDSLSDDWEIFYFDTLQFDANDNSDGDLLTNIQEFNALLDPSTANENTDIFEVVEGWNLLSIPARVARPATVNSLFAGRYMGSSWTWKNGRFYAVKDDERLDTNIGYWIFITGNTPITFMLDGQ